MKKLVKILFFSLSFFAILGFSNVLYANAAEAKKDDTLKIRAYDTGSDSFDVTLDHYGDTIENLKITTKKARVKIGKIDRDKGLNDGVVTESCIYGIDFYLKEYGTYTITFDIVGEDGKKISSKKAIVYCYEDPFTIKLDKKNVDDIGFMDVTAKSGKVTVTSNKKNPIKTLEYGVFKQVEEGSKDEGNYSTTAEIVYKKFKSGSKITFNTVPEGSSRISVYETETYANNSEYTWESYCARTAIRITYKDAYTGNTEVYEDGYAITRYAD